MNQNGYSWVGDYDFVSARNKKSLEEFENELGITHRLFLNPIDEIFHEHDTDALKFTNDIVFSTPNHI